MRGHTLIWHQDKWLPSWIATYDFGTDAAVSTRTLTTGVINYHGTRIALWDVVNEVVDPATGNLYATRLSCNLNSPEAVVGLAFTTASPTQLVYNNYAGWEPGNDAHHTACCGY